MRGEGKEKMCELPKWISFQKERREPILNGQIGAHERISLFRPLIPAVIVWLLGDRPT